MKKRDSLTGRQIYKKRQTEKERRIRQTENLTARDRQTDLLKSLDLLDAGEIWVIL